MTDDLRYQWSARHQGSTCIACGSLVVDTDAHDQWHAALEQRRSLLVDADQVGAAIDRQAFDLGALLGQAWRLQQQLDVDTPRSAHDLVDAMVTTIERIATHAADDPKRMRAVIDGLRAARGIE